MDFLNLSRIEVFQKRHQLSRLNRLLCGLRPHARNTYAFCGELSQCLVIVASTLPLMVNDNRDRLSETAKSQKGKFSPEKTGDLLTVLK
ncbi:hypothetical protein J2T08_006297 [Neorhizobium galegae]|uniref:hypothetical protein n=1 Tax=Neorhizobium galegae TaxID=399 RepID=UPI001AE9A52C|nr:hypothetical protein [Neorhizobium galegae]MBP2562312.1 hypothetical protein [Neorhizobium galegae]MDQ0138352.1 hypothetical protein [Neorhizobium galegae]